MPIEQSELERFRDADPYTVLGIEVDTISAETVNAAFSALMQTYSLEQNDDPLAKEIVSLITTATITVMTEIEEIFEAESVDPQIELGRFLSLFLSHPDTIRNEVSHYLALGLVLKGHFHKYLSFPKYKETVVSGIMFNLECSNNPLQDALEYFTAWNELGLTFRELINDPKISSLLLAEIAKISDSKVSEEMFTKLRALGLKTKN